MCLPLEDLATRTLGTGEHAGFTYQIVSNGMGFRCGYVRVYPGHPWFGKHYDDIDANVHGGLTFSDAGMKCETHDEDAEWWVGFDCGHSGDAPDPELIVGKGRRSLNPIESFFLSLDCGGTGVGSHVWTQEEVIGECKSLAEQAASALNNSAVAEGS
jgi:hypothetical protein